MKQEDLIQEYLNGNKNIHCSIEEIDTLTCNNCVFNKELNSLLPKNNTNDICNKECNM